MGLDKGRINARAIIPGVALSFVTGRNLVLVHSMRSHKEEDVQMGLLPTTPPSRCRKKQATFLKERINLGKGTARKFVSAADRSWEGLETWIFFFFFGFLQNSFTGKGFLECPFK